MGGYLDQGRGRRVHSSEVECCEGCGAQGIVDDVIFREDALVWIAPPDDQDGRQRPSRLLCLDCRRP